MEDLEESFFTCEACRYDANVRLCERLGVDEDKDVDIIIDSMNEIARILAMKMYDYGANREMFDQK